MNTVSYDHPDPCIFTVLQCVTEDPGVSALDFVIFPPRWMVSENTFRPPYYHRNSMSEYMGYIQGVYDAKDQTVSLGESTLHSCMSAHGPEASVFERESNIELKPIKYGQDSLAFMFETTYMLKVNVENEVDQDYYRCWQGIKKLFQNQK